MKIFAIANQKGGCGKTTTAINLSRALSMNGKSVLLIDLDPQSHATAGLNIDSEWSMYDILSNFSSPKRKLKEVTVKLKEGFYVAPSSILLSTLEQEMANEIGREGRLKSILSSVNDYDYCIIDCPPNLGILTINAIHACDMLIAPLEMSRFSFEGLQRLKQILDLVYERLGHSVIFKVLVTIFDSRLKYSFRLLEKIKSSYPRELLSTIIHVNVKLKEAANEGMSVFSFDKYCRGSKDYFSLAREIITDNELANYRKEAAQLLKDEVDRFVDTEFRLYAPAAQHVYLAGDFNQWHPNEQSRCNCQQGYWKKTLRLKPGRYRYRFVVDGTWQEDPENPITETNPFGEVDSLVELR